MSTSSSRARTAALRTAALMILVVLCSFPAADLAFRAAGDRPSRDLTGLFTPFGDGGFRLSAGVRTSAAFYSGRMDVFTDSLGLRVDSTPSTWTAPADSVDFLLMGDSQGFGNLLNFDKSLAGQVAARAQSAGFHVANTSVGAHYLENQIEIVRWLVAERQVTLRHIVVLLTPVLISTSAGYNRAAVSSDGRLYSGEQSFSWRVRMWLKTNTVAYSRVRGAYRSLNSLWMSRFGPSGGPTAGDEPAVLQLYDPESNTKRAVPSSLFRELASIKSLADSVSARLSVVYLPLSTEMSFGVIQEAARRSGKAVDPDLPYALTSQVADSLRIPRISCKPALVRTLERGAKIGIGDDPHYSADASRECARDIWTFLEQQQPPTITTPWNKHR